MQRLGWFTGLGQSVLYSLSPFIVVKLWSFHFSKPLYIRHVNQTFGLTYCSSNWSKQKILIPHLCHATAASSSLSLFPSSLIFIQASPVIPHLSTGCQEDLASGHFLNPSPCLPRFSLIVYSFCAEDSDQSLSGRLSIHPSVTCLHFDWLSSWWPHLFSSFHITNTNFYSLTNTSHNILF